MSMSICLCLHVHVHVSMSMSACPCLRIHVSMPSCLRFSMFPCLMSMSLSFHSLSLSPFLYVSRFPCPCLNVSGIHKWKTELTENSIFRLFATNRNRKRKFVFHGLKTINGNRRLLLQQTFPSMVTRYIATRVSIHICYYVTVPNL
jgi:hypothetical protein